MYGRGLGTVAGCMAGAMEMALDVWQGPVSCSWMYDSGHGAGTGYMAGRRDDVWAAQLPWPAVRPQADVRSVQAFFIGLVNIGEAAC